MNRKMRSKLNNAEARKKRDCPNRGKLIQAAPEQTVCDTCGDELGEPVAVVAVLPLKKEDLH